MSITITLSEETEIRLKAEAEAQGTEPAVLLADLIEDLYGHDKGSENPNTIKEIGQALSALEADEAGGEQGLSVDEAFAELERRGSDRQSQKMQKAA
ncbi:MAG: hypothetical protein V4671_09370 [Armatimonadota bacterium]